MNYKWLYHDENCVRTWRWLPEKFQTSKGVTSDVACSKTPGQLPATPDNVGGSGNPVNVGRGYIPNTRSRRPRQTILGLPPSYLAPGLVGASSLGGLGLGYYGGFGSNEGGVVTSGLGGQGIEIPGAPVTNNTHMYVVSEPSAAWILLYGFILLLFLGRITKR